LPFGFVFLKKEWSFVPNALGSWLGIPVALELLVGFYFKDIFFKNQ
jgi:hypothetical protein